ncbi:hypothetical protein AALP_AAs69390U000100 [Arabis alpina]|uniref:Uncharacterized protein n=1 Tax=Arabis alpina TaxID=50452 RepID=A0A087G1Z1_ARAAL|nr:hypothetical protein AALP_AAs69390U000100 [Arabis alpina]
MCSNNNNNIGSYGKLQQEDEDDYFGSCSKKQKKVKVRRRGSGVAQLEKIRLQEEKKKSSHSSSSSPNLDHTLFAPPRGVSDFVMMSPNFALHNHTMNPCPGGFYQFLEPPSNQRSCFDINVSQLLDEDKKMVIAKRPWNFVTETISRDVKQNRSLDMRLITTVQDSGTAICNPNSIRSPTSIPSFPRHYPRFIPQYDQQQKDFDENEQRTSMKPFYNFLPSNEQSNGDQEHGASDHEIDLSLKL